MDTKHYLRLLRTFALAALTAAATAACSDDTDPDREPITPDDANPGIAVNFTANINPGSDADPAGAPDTRTVLEPDGDGGFTVKWKGKDTYPDDYDRIVICAAKGNTLENNGYGIYLPTTSEASSALEYEEKLTLSSGGDWKFTAVYGYYSAWNGVAIVDISPLTQSAPGNTEHIAKNDFSIAIATQNILDAGSEMPQNINLQFHHKLSALQLQVKNETGEALTVREIRLSVTGNKITSRKNYGAIAGDWLSDGVSTDDYLQLRAENFPELPSDGTAQNLHMLLFPEPAHGGTDMTITVITDRGEYTLTKPAPSGGFIAGKNYLTDITITSTPGTNETWTETISTPEQLAAFRNKVNGGDNYQGKTIYLADNIDLANASWTPIGTDGNKPFSGTFDGGGYSISGLNVNISENYAGLFGYVKDGTVRNLRVKGTVTTTESYVGGIIGGLSGTTVENCIFSGEVNGRTYVGGIAGSTSKSSSITGQIAGCYTKGKVTATNGAVGGIAGSHSDITMTDCYSEAEVTAINLNAGGIIGNSRNSTITRCYATGAISSGKQAGGIVGNNYGTTVTNCFALNPSLTRTSGNETTFGRVVGKDNDGGSVTSCFAFKDMTIKDDSNNNFTVGATSVAGTDLTREQCVTGSTYSVNYGISWDTGWNAGTNPLTYLPWIKAFESFPGIQPADYRISVPQHITDALIP